MNKNKEIREKVKKILNSGVSGDLDAFGCAEYNPELVDKVLNLISQAEDNMRKRCVEAVEKRMLTEKKRSENPDQPEKTYIEGKYVGLRYAKEIIEALDQATQNINNLDKE